MSVLKSFFIKTLDPDADILHFFPLKDEGYPDSMNKKDRMIAIPDEIIMNKIYLIRDKKVMLDRDLAELYEVETKHL